MKIRIECDGTKTKVTDAETGESLHATKVMFVAEVGQAPKIVVECIAPFVSAVSEGEIVDTTRLDSINRTYAMVRQD